jgi:nucleotide-binding universal stress UspA family protein
VIVIGSHDRGWFSKLFTPSVSSALVREADIPVLITR